MNANTAFSYRFGELTCYDWSHHAGNGGKGVGDSQQDPSKPAHTRTHTHRFCETQIAAGFSETPPEFHVAVRQEEEGWEEEEEVGGGRNEVGEEEEEEVEEQIVVTRERCPGG